MRDERDLFQWLVVKGKCVGLLDLEFVDFAVDPLEVFKKSFLVRSSFIRAQGFRATIFLDNKIGAELTRSADSSQGGVSEGALYLIVFHIKEGLIPIFDFRIHGPAIMYSVGIPENQMSRFRTFNALSSINCRRGSTSSPMSRVNIPSASIASVKSTRNSLRWAGFIVVSKSSLGFISPRPLNRLIVRPRRPTSFTLESISGIANSGLTCSFSPCPSMTSNSGLSWAE